MSAVVDTAELERCERVLTACRCAPDFKDRDMIDPLCAACDVGDEVIETFRMLRAEKQRMDFIESHPGWLSVRRRKRKSLWLCAPFSNYEQDLHSTARDAIDAALAAQQPTQPAEGE